jgi:serpin B
VQKEGRVQLQVANALWPQLGYRFLEEYLEILRQHYGASVTALDYAVSETARREINGWVDRKTEGKIEELIGPGVLNPRTRLVLTNAIYFKGDWAQQFDEVRTKPQAFWIAPTEKVDVPTMSQVDTFGFSQREPGLQVLELPYAGHELSMLLLLPEKVDGIGELEETLTAENLQRWTNNLSPMEVAVHIPRFTVRCQFSLREALKSLGITDAFGDAADFSGMDGRRGLYLSAVIHQAYVDVNEEGTEAAAATAALMATMSVPLPPPVFRADHPFVFLIRENSTGTILFLGRVSNPLAGDG